MTSGNLQPVRAALLENRCLIIAHRGFVSRTSVPENSLAAFSRAGASGADGVELDVRLSRDNQLIVFHDASLKRMAGRSRRVHETLGGVIRNLPLVVDGKPTHEFIPILEQVLAEIGGRLYLNIELKASVTRAASLASLVAQAVERANMSAWVWFSSFQPLALWHVKRALPEVPAGLLFSRWHLVYRLLSRFHWINALHPNVKLMPWFDQLRARGKPLVFWTVNQPAQVAQLCSLGVAALITDDVEMAVRARQLCQSSRRPA